MQAIIEKNKIKVSFSFSREKIDLCKNLDMKWSNPEKVWWLPDNLMNRQIINTLPTTEKLPVPKAAPIAFYEPPKYLMGHQKDAVTLGLEKSRHLYAYDTGTGKTLIGIELHKQKKVKTLVVCPISIIEPAWMEDLKKFAPEIKAVNLWKLWKKSKPIPKVERAIKLYDICIINFESFKSMQKLLEGQFDMVLIDESSKVKNYKAAIAKALIAFCDNVRYCYLFSGTPAPNNYMEYWSQARIVNPMVFGKSFYKFRNRYFFSYGYGNFLWKLRPDLNHYFMERLARIQSVVRKEDVLDLPERTDNIIDVYLNKDELHAYKEMKDNLLLEIEDETITVANAAVKIMKLRQVTAGFLIGEDSNVHEVGRSKLKALQDLLESLGDAQVIIWTQFHYEAEQISHWLLMMQIEHGTVNGTVKQSDREKYIKEFKEGKIQYIIAHPKSMGHGITLINCTYAVYYSLDYSHEGHYQSRDRIYRKGQKNACTYYYLLAQKTIDPVIFKALNDKASSEKAVFDYIKKGFF